MRKVKDHVEADFNHFRRGKSHTKPAKETDVAKLQEAYAASEIHVFTPTRSRLSKEAHATDYLLKGSNPTLLRKTINKWAKRRMKEKSTEQDWTDYAALAAARMAHGGAAAQQHHASLDETGAYS